MTGRFGFIDAEYAAYQESEHERAPSIVQMCRWLEVSRSGFCGWRNAPESATARWRGILTLIVKKSFDESDGTYGYRRVRADLVARGVPAGPELVRSVMRELGLEPCQPRPWRFSLTEGDGREHDIPGLVKRDFTAGAPGRKMVGGITCIPMWQGWLYLGFTWRRLSTAIRRKWSAGRRTITTRRRSSRRRSRWPPVIALSLRMLFSIPTAAAITLRPGSRGR